LVEYDPDSQWYNASLTIVVQWFSSGGERAAYHQAMRPPEYSRSMLRRMGLDVEALERSDRLRFIDYYSATLGQKSNEKHPAPSLKVADLSINVSRQIKESAELLRKFLGICDDLSFMTRFNDERSWVEWMLTRNLPGGRRMALSIDAVIKGVHSPSAYNQLEAAYDGIIDFKVEEIGSKTVDLMRIRSMRNARFERNWHHLNIGASLEITLEKQIG